MKSPSKVDCPNCGRENPVTRRKSRIAQRPVRTPTCTGCKKPFKVHALSLKTEA